MKYIITVITFIFCLLLNIVSFADDIIVSDPIMFQLSTQYFHNHQYPVYESRPTADITEIDIPDNLNIDTTQQIIKNIDVSVNRDINYYNTYNNVNCGHVVISYEDESGATVNIYNKPINIRSHYE